MLTETTSPLTPSAGFTKLTNKGVIRLDEIEKVAEELVASFEHTQGHQRAWEVPAYVLSQTLHPAPMDQSNSLTTHTECYTHAHEM